jgi:hypothetical protein
MDEDEDYVTINPIRHNRWSVLILGLDWAGKVAMITGSTLTAAMLTACEHANQLKYEEKFKEVTRGL